MTLTAHPNPTKSPKTPMVAFLLRAIACLLVMTLGWSLVSKWSSYPVALLSKAVLVYSADDWVQAVQTKPGMIEVQTRLLMKVRGVEADIVVDADPARYGYGLPIFLALLLAAPRIGQPRHLVKLAVAGFLLLLPGQAFSLCMDLLKQMVVAMPGGARALGIAQWQLEAIALGYQLGSLVVPTVLPIVLWIGLNRNAVSALTHTTPSAHTTQNT